MLGVDWVYLEWSGWWVLFVLRFGVFAYARVTLYPLGNLSVRVMKRVDERGGICMAFGASHHGGDVGWQSKDRSVDEMVDLFC